MDDNKIYNHKEEFSSEFQKSSHVKVNQDSKACAKQFGYPCNRCISFLLQLNFRISSKV